MHPRSPLGKRVASIPLFATALVCLLLALAAAGPLAGAGQERPQGPRYVLYDQYNYQARTDITSQDYEPMYDPNDAEAADDFEVYFEQMWWVSEVDVDGEYSSGGGPAASFNVSFYRDNYGTPGELLYAATGRPFVGTQGDAQITLGYEAVFRPGHYWVSVQARQDFAGAGQWFWQNRSAWSFNASVWRNPGGGLGTPCTNWSVRTRCFAAPQGPDQVFRLLGWHVITSPVPTPWPTPTPTRTPVPDGAVTPAPSGIGTPAPPAGLYLPAVPLNAEAP